MSRPPFVFWSEGRLGNQMSQYAFCHALAEKERRPFIFLSHSVDVHQCFRLGSRWEIARFSGRPARLLRAGVSAFMDMTKVDSWTDPSEAWTKVMKASYLAGYFQGASFFSGHDEAVAQFFCFADGIQDQVGSVFSRRGWSDLSRTAVVHVRRGDYLGFGDDRLGGQDLSLPASWFHAACERIAEVPVERAVVISDDPVWCRGSLSLPWPWECSGEDMLSDFSLLREAAACILSPSSFSWWGAWLNKRQGRTVVVPRFWLGHKVGLEYPPKVVPNTWIQV